VSPRRGATLLELLVVLAIMGIAGSTAAIWLRDDRASGRASMDDHIAAARRDALRTGGTVTVVLEMPDGPAVLSVFPDGSVAAEPRLRRDPLTGRERKGPE
jgi:prepilin-type N-terminal cleavage/methylation domain-containing protein